MKKGYDQLHNGISTKLDVSYRYYGDRNNFQFYIGTNLTAAYTQNQRPYSLVQINIVMTHINGIGCSVLMLV